MNAAAEAVMRELPDLVLAYGNSDEFRYVYLHYHLVIRSQLYVWEILEVSYDEDGRRV